MLGIFDHRTSIFFSSHADWERSAASSMSLTNLAPVEAVVSDTPELTPTAPVEEEEEWKEEKDAAEPEDRPAAEGSSMARPCEAAAREDPVMKEGGHPLCPASALASSGAEKSRKTARGSGGGVGTKKRQPKKACDPPTREEEHSSAKPSRETQKRARPSLELGEEASVTSSPRKKRPERLPAEQAEERALPDASLSQEQNAAEALLEERGGGSLLVEARVKASVKKHAEGLRMKKEALAALELRARRLLDLAADKVLSQGRKVLNDTDF